MRAALGALLAGALLIAAYFIYINVAQPKMLAAPEQTAAASSSIVRDRLLIEVAGSNSGTIEIELLNDIAPHHVQRIMALAKAGKYDNIVFHRVIDGFMAQTGDVEFGVRGSDSISRAGEGSSDMPDLKAEFSSQKFVAGTVGMARAASEDSANSQFFITFAKAPFLNGKYTVVGHVVAGQDVLNSIRKGDPNLNGAVENPDYMKTVRVKSGS